MRPDQDCSRYEWLLGVVALSGCAVHFPATQVDLEKPAALNEPGIYYHLPKTVFELSIPVKYTVYDSGEMTKLIECWNDPEKQRAATKTKGSSALVCGLLREVDVLEFRPASLVRKPVPDRSHTYKVLPNTKWYMSLSHKLTNDAGGFVSGASSGGSNETATIALDVAKSLVGATSVFGGAPRTLGFALTDGARSDGGRPARPGSITPRCQAEISESDEAVLTNAEKQIGRDVATFVLQVKPGKPIEFALDDSGAPVLLTRVMGALRCREMVIQRARTGLQKVLAATSRGRSPSSWPPELVRAYIDVAAEPAKVRLAKATAMLATLRGELRLDGKKNEGTVVLRFAELLDVSVKAAAAGQEDVTYAGIECKPMIKRNVQDWCVLDLEKMAVVPRIDAKIGSDADALRLLKDGTRLIAARIERVDRDLDVALSASLAAASAAGTRKDLGYRYRLPAEGRVRVALIEREDKGDGKAWPSGEPTDNSNWDQYPWTALADSTGSVAQFGPIVTLPESFDGREVSIDVSFTDSGGLRELTLGQKAHSAAGVTGVIDAAAAERGKRDEARTKAAEAAAKAPVEQAQSANALLEAQLKKAKYERCLKLLASNPDAALPDGCP